jgi:hypothetical protein
MESDEGKGKYGYIIISTYSRAHALNIAARCRAVVVNRPVRNVGKTTLIALISAAPYVHSHLRLWLNEMSPLRQVRERHVTTHCACVPKQCFHVLAHGASRTTLTSHLALTLCALILYISTCCHAGLPPDSTNATLHSDTFIESNHQHRSRLARNVELTRYKRAVTVISAGTIDSGDIGMETINSPRHPFPVPLTHGCLRSTSTPWNS